MDKLTSVSPTLNKEKTYRIGGISGIALGVSYVIITVLYVFGGTLSGGAENWLGHIAAHTSEWWAILAFSVLTDILFIPMCFALYTALNGIDKNFLSAGVGFIILFVLLDLAVTWPNYASLIALGGDYAAATDQTVFLAAAAYAHSVLSSGLFAVYAVLFPSLGILFIGFVMLKGNFGKIAAYLGIATGILGILSVIGPFIVPALDVLVIITSILTTVWVVFSGYKLLKLKPNERINIEIS